MDQQLYKFDQAAQLLAVGRSSVYELVEAGELERVKIGRSARITEASVRAYVDRLRAEAAAVR